MQLQAPQILGLLLGHHIDQCRGQQEFHVDLAHVVQHAAPLFPGLYKIPSHKQFPSDSSEKPAGVLGDVFVSSGLPNGNRSPPRQRGGDIGPQEIALVERGRKPELRPFDGVLCIQPLHQLGTSAQWLKEFGHLEEEGEGGREGERKGGRGGGIWGCSNAQFFL